MTAVVEVRWDSGGGYGSVVTLPSGVPTTLDTGLVATDCGTSVVLSNGDIENPVERIQGTIEIRLGNVAGNTRPKTFELYDGTLTKDVPVDIEFTSQQVISKVRDRFVTPWLGLDRGRRELIEYYLDNGPNLNIWSNNDLKQIVDLGPDLISKEDFVLTTSEKFTIDNGAGYPGGTTTMHTDGWDNPPAVGQTFKREGGDQTEYTITAHSGWSAGGAGDADITFTPGLAGSESDNQNFRVNGYAAGATQLSIRNVGADPAGLEFTIATTPAVTRTAASTVAMTSNGNNKPESATVALDTPLTSAITNTGTLTGAFTDLSEFIGVSRWSCNDPDQTGSPWNFIDRVPMFVAILELIRRGDTPSQAQLDEMDKFIEDVSRRGNYVWVDNDPLQPILKSYLDDNNYIIHQGYRNTKGGGFSTLFSHVMPSGVSESWSQGIMLSSAQHWSLQAECLIALFTNDLAAARVVDQQIECLVHDMTHEPINDSLRAFGWAYEAIAWAMATLGQYSAIRLARWDSYISLLLDQQATYAELDGPRGSTWIAVGQDPPYIPYSAFFQQIGEVTDGLSAGDSEDRLTGCKVFPLGIQICGLSRLIEIAPLTFQTYQKVSQTLDVGLNNMIGQVFAQTVLTYNEEIKVGGDNITVPNFCLLGYDIGPVVEEQSSAASGVTPRFVLPCLYRLSDRYPQYNALIQDAKTRTITQAGGWFNAPSTAPWTLMEWMWRPWGAGDTDFGLPTGFAQFPGDDADPQGGEETVDFPDDTLDGEPDPET